MPAKKIIPVFLLLFIFASVRAQDSLTAINCWLCKNNNHTATNPYNYGWKHEIPYIASAVGLMTIGIVIDKTNSIEPYTPQELLGLNRDDINTF